MVRLVSYESTKPNCASRDNPCEFSNCCWSALIKSWSAKHSRMNERDRVFSPDSRWIAYVSNESGKAEVYLQPFAVTPASTATGPKILLSRGGGTSPLWRAGGKEVLYRSADGKLTSTAVNIVGSPRAGIPQPLFPLPGAGWHATGDSNRFLVGVPVEQGAPPFTVLLNWQSELRK